MIKRLLLWQSFLLIFSYQSSAQFTKQDTLRGSVGPERAWWDLNYYHLDISVDPDKKWLEGSNTVAFTALEDGNVIQIDLQKPLTITAAKCKKRKLEVRSEGNAHFITLPKTLKKGETESIEIYYEGHPVEAKRPPWDGGLTYRKDSEGS